MAAGETPRESEASNIGVKSRTNGALAVGHVT